MSELRDKNADSAENTPGQDFLRARISKDMAEGKFNSRVQTRFPPEPNGYLHIGHAKSINLNFGLAAEFNGACNLRFDDTNPVKENVEFVSSIKEDVLWLGFAWAGEPRFASDYFEELYGFAQLFIKAGIAYVDQLSPAEIREHRGTLTTPGKPGPWRDRPIEDSLDLFRRMRAGEFRDEEYVLRAKIDMASANVIMRDPTLYRIRHAHHHRTGDVWPIYPMYDYTHCISDFLERITHSICTLEFENNRELYNWTLDNLIRLLAVGDNRQKLEAYRNEKKLGGTAVFPDLNAEPNSQPDGLTRADLQQEQPQQIEFARLNLSRTILSKRKLIQLVNEGFVRGWDDPRMPTLTGLRRRGYTPEAIRSFCDRIGVARTADAVVDYALLEFCAREHLNAVTPRCMAVQAPLKIIIENYPADQEEIFDLPLYPEDDSFGSRLVPFSREIYIELDDFREEAPKKWHRLSPGLEVRLRYAYFITCKDVIKDAQGNVTGLICVYDPASRGGSSPDGRKVKGTIHWVSAKHCMPIEVRLYDHLFRKATGQEGEEELSLADMLNPESLTIVNALGEPYLGSLRPGARVQFERLGYYCADADSSPEHKVFNRTVTLKDSWTKLEVIS